MELKGRLIVGVVVGLVFGTAIALLTEGGSVFLKIVTVFFMVILSMAGCAFRQRFWSVDDSEIEKEELFQDILNVLKSSREKEVSFECTVDFENVAYFECVISQSKFDRDPKFIPRRFGRRYDI